MTIRVLVRVSKCNPRRFIVKDPLKIANWKMLAEKYAEFNNGVSWNGRNGIKIEEEKVNV